MSKPRPSFPARLDLPANPTRHVGTGTGMSAGLLKAVAQPDTRVALHGNLGRQSAHRAMPTAPQGHGMDSSAVRLNMVAKLAALGITDPQVLAAMRSIERHRFVDSALVNQAYEDTSLPIGLGQTISKPSVVSRMAELLRNGAPGKLGRVLEIGTGCGYQAAVLSLLATEVYSMERLRGLHDKARDNLRYLRIPNLHLLFGDGRVGYPKGGPYSAIIAAAGGEAVPQAWIEQLAIGGRLVAPVCVAGGTAGQQTLMLIDKTSAGCQQTILEAVHFVPLKSGVA